MSLLCQIPMCQKITGACLSFFEVVSLVKLSAKYLGVSKHINIIKTEVKEGFWCNLDIMLTQQNVSIFIMRSCMENVYL